jgi:hypothetical protein
MAVADSVDPDGWMVILNELLHRIAGRFHRVEPAVRPAATCGGCRPTSTVRTAGTWPSVAASQTRDYDERIRLTVPEIRRLLAALLLTSIRSIELILHWSQWRRRHQATAKRCHYQRRSQP